LPSATISLHLAVTNLGPSAAASVTVFGPLRASVTFVSARHQDSAPTRSGTVTCNLGTLNSNASATVTIVGDAEHRRLDHQQCHGSSSVTTPTGQHSALLLPRRRT